MNPEQLKLLTEEERYCRDRVSALSIQMADVLSEARTTIDFLAAALADSRLEIANLTEERDEAIARLANQVAELAQQREDIRRLMGALAKAEEASSHDSDCPDCRHLYETNLDPQESQSCKTANVLHWEARTLRQTTLAEFKEKYPDA